VACYTASYLAANTPASDGWDLGILTNSQAKIVFHAGTVVDDTRTLAVHDPLTRRYYLVQGGANR